VQVDVLVVGSGAAGVSAAIEARTLGASVLLLESLPRFGGASGMSGGVVYAGGGTALQKALGIEDSVDAMYDFLSQAGGPHPSPDKVQVYCEESPAHFDWLVAQGIPYSEKFAAARGLPMGDESLYFSGTELAWPARELAKPAPRGHVPGTPGMNGGRGLMAALLARAESLGVELRAGIPARRLITERDGRVVGLVAGTQESPLSIKARAGVVLAAGGFVHNPEMLRRYAPELADCSVPWGNMADRGDAINMGMSAGAAALRMHQGFAIAPVYPPENVLSAILVNSSGQRFIAEDAYHGVLGDAIAFHQSGRAWLITDQRSAYTGLVDNFLPVATANSIGDVAEQLPLPKGALQHTVAFYNRFATIGEDPMFHKSAKHLRPLQGPPYTAWDLSVKNAFFAAHTLGGLDTTVDGCVLDGYGDPIPGLYAAGRTSAGLPTAPYLASGLSVGDCTFFGRRAGRAAVAGGCT
jgi:3-oxo-5alpha-steroid 4-dehydrogenase